VGISRLATCPSIVVSVCSQSFSKRECTASALPRIGQQQDVLVALVAWWGMVSNEVNPARLSLGQSLLNAASPPWKMWSAFCSTTVSLSRVFSKSLLLSLSGFSARAHLM